MPIYTQESITFGASTPVALDGGTVVGPLTVTGATDITGNSTVTGTFGVTGNTTVTGTFGVTGAGAVNQSSASGAVAVQTLTQADVDDAFIDYVGTSAGDATKSITTLTVAAIAGYVKKKVNGTAKWFAFYGTPSA